MDTLAPLPNDFAPIDDHLAEIYKRLSEATLAAEENRLRDQFFDIGSRILAISIIRGTA